MRNRSRTNREGGFVLTWKEIASPARTEAREQYPSIHGERKRLSGSTRGRSRSQSRVPMRWFSVTMRFGDSPIGLNRTPVTNVTGRESAFKQRDVRRRFPPPHICVETDDPEQCAQMVGVAVGVAVAVVVGSGVPVGSGVGVLWPEQSSALPAPRICTVSASSADEVPRPSRSPAASISCPSLRSPKVAAAPPESSKVAFLIFTTRVRWPPPETTQTFKLPFGEPGTLRITPRKVSLTLAGRAPVQSKSTSSRLTTPLRVTSGRTTSPWQLPRAKVTVTLPVGAPGRSKSPWAFVMSDAPPACTWTPSRAVLACANTRLAKPSSSSFAQASQLRRTGWTDADALDTLPLTVLVSLLPPPPP